jgi:serine/threonine-protein kinase
MAEVFEACREGSTERLVIKVLLPQHAADPDFVQMFEDEARLTLGFDHPNLVRVVDFCVERGENFIVMEYVEGSTLAGLLRHAREAGHHLPVPLCLLVGKDILQALDYIHSRSGDDGHLLDIVHRDVTPGNVLLSREGAVKLGDFGIARHRLRSARTRTGVIKGTVQYMAPEHVSGGTSIDRRTDLYGVGLILFEMLTGRPFIQGERELEMLSLALDPPWTPPSQLRPDLDPQLDRILRTALARFPEERYPDACSFLKALSQVADVPREERALRGQLCDLVNGLESTTRPVDRATIPDRPAGGTRRVDIPARGPGGSARRPVAVIAAGLGTAAALAAAAWLGLRSGHHPPDTTGARDISTSERRDALTGGPSGGAASRPPVDSREPVGQRDAGHPMDGGAGADLRRQVTRVPGRRHAARPVRDAGPSKPLAPDARGVDERADLKRRLAATLTSLRGRGILEDDLPDAVRAELRVAREQVERRDAPAARRAIEELTREAARVTVDRAFVETKLRRVEVLLRAARGSGGELQAWRARGDAALQEIMDGRYQAANRRLNELLGALGGRSLTR